MPEILIPRADWSLRDYQKPLWKALVHDGKNICATWHRRAGKDEVLLNALAVKSMQRPASYAYMFPEISHARRAMWQAVNPHTGQRRIFEAFPRGMLSSDPNETEMRLSVANGSSIMFFGSDQYDRLVGASLAGIVSSEHALSHPSAYGFFSPMLRENGGFFAAISTPRGNNHFKGLFDYAQASASWLAQRLSVEDTGALSEVEIEDARLEYLALYGIDLGLAMFEQEYLCSFSGAMVGAYFGAEMSKAEREGRIKKVDIDPLRPVHTAWDLGKATNNPIWCFQVIGGQLMVVDFYIPESDDIEEWCAWLNQKGYNGNDYVPHDILVTEWGSKRTRIETLRALGRKPKRIPKVSVADGLQAGRVAINAAQFDEGRCGKGIEGLKAYRREWDDERKTFRENPVKDWAEHIGSAWRYLGLSWREETIVIPSKPKAQEPVYTAMPDGTVQSNVNIREQIEAMVRRKRGNG